MTDRGRPFRFQIRGWKSRIAVVAVFAFTAIYGLDAVFRWIDAPWSYAALGPTLTGPWEGPLQARQGTSYRLYLDIAYERVGRSATNLRGSARVCSRNGGTFNLGLRGSANRSGNRIELVLYPPDDRPAPTIPLIGGWDGQALTLRATDNPFQRDGTYQTVRTVSTSAPEDGFGITFLRASDLARFEAACRALGS